MSVRNPSSSGGADVSVPRIDEANVSLVLLCTVSSCVDGFSSSKGSGGVGAGTSIAGGA